MMQRIGKGWWTKLGQDEGGWRATALVCPAVPKGPGAGAHITFWAFTDTSDSGSFRERDSPGGRVRETRGLSNTSVYCCCHSSPYHPAEQRKNSPLPKASRLERHGVKAAQGLSGVSAGVSKGQKCGLQQWK